VLTVAALDGDGVAICETPGGAPETVDVSLIEPPRVGDRVLVHAGVALAHLGDRAGR
jgi:hydrogenase maturation factor